MHSALGIPEILSLIFEHLVPPPDACHDYIRKPDQVLMQCLVNTALVCKPFNAPSLDCLWRVMDDLNPLFRLLPPFGRHGEDRQVGYIHGPILPGDLDRFNQYARRIRFCLLYGPQLIHHSVYSRIQHECGPLSILPSLQRLQVGDETVYGSLDYMAVAEGCTFVCTSLRYLSFAIYQTKPQEDFYSVITALPVTCSNVRHLKLIAHLTIPCITSIFKLCYLESLEITRNGQDTFIDIDIFDLSSRSSLRKLSIHDGMKLHSPPNTSRPSHEKWTSFDCLRELAITLDRQSVRTLTAVLQQGFFPELQALAVDVSDTDNQLFKSSEMPRWVDFLQSLPGATTKQFTSLSLQNISCNSTEGLEALSFSIASVPELKRLSLTTLQINLPLLFHSVSETDLKTIVSWWPNLKILELDGTGPETNLPSTLWFTLQLTSLNSPFSRFVSRFRIGLLCRQRQSWSMNFRPSKYSA